MATTTHLIKRDLKHIRLNKLNVPYETLRKDSFPESDEQLKKSLELLGILVPMVVRELGRGEYEVWDGTRRLRLLKELGTSGSTLIPAHVVNGNDSDAVVAQMNINQIRERLNRLAELEALRQLVKEHKWKQKEAAEKLMKSETWASEMIKIFELPKPILNDMHDDNINVSQAVILAKFIEHKEILQILYDEAKMNYPAASGRGISKKL